MGLALLALSQEICGGTLTAFELMENTPVTFTFTHMEGVRNPLDQIHPWQVMLEVSSSRSQKDADTLLQELMESALEEGCITDAALSGSIAQQRDFWRIREAMPLAQKHEGASMKHDVSVPVAAAHKPFCASCFQRPGGAC